MTIFQVSEQTNQTNFPVDENLPLQANITSKKNKTP